MRYIKRVSKVKNDDTKGYIINSTNIENKEENAYSANVIDGLLQLGSQGWKPAGINTDMYSSGRVRYMQIGKLVIVDFSDLLLKGNPTGDVVLVYGLPPASELEIFTINGTNGGSIKTNHRMYLNQVGNVGNWYDTQESITSMYYYGQLIYLAK